MTRREALRKLLTLPPAVATCAQISCGPEIPTIFYPKAVGTNGETFGYRKWISPKTDPDVVIIGIHGFCGASIDYTNLGKHLLRHQPETALYAYELRGQGSDPIHERRGDIGRPDEWYTDLFAFTGMVRKQHPNAQIIWFGESMGALIAAHAWRAAPSGSSPCDGIALSSPIVRFRDDIPDWTPSLVKAAATTLPVARVSLTTLSSGQNLQMTETSQHGDQVKTNPYHVEQHTLRLIGTLTQLIDGMNDCAASFQKPVLVLHGGKDFLNTDPDVRGFVARIPQGTPSTYHNYPGSHHLLMYDRQRNRVFRDIARWIERLRNRDL
ncbi:MAG: alpha/beta fold hydrolase [Verrucomicrobiales bacterium]